MKYKKQDVINYLNGLLTKNVKLLENDSNFMIDVINFCNDKNIYFKCSNKLKQNHTFIIYLIIKFHKDINFIIKISQNYLKVLKETSDIVGDIKFIEVNIIMDKYLKEHSFSPKPPLTTYATNANIFKTYLISKVDNELKQATEKEQKELGLGFTLVETVYYESDIIKSFFATTLLEKLFKPTSYFETKLHKEYHIPDFLDSQTSTNFLINYISSYDYYLARYIEKHIFLIKDILKQLDYIIKNWQNYDQKAFQRKFHLHKKLTQEILQKYNSHLSYEEICSYLNNQGYDFNTIITQFSLPNVINLNDYKCLKEITNLTKKLFSKQIEIIQPNQNQLSKNRKILKPTSKHN